NAGVVTSCSKLCSHLPGKAEQTACNLACDLAGIKEFVHILNHTDLDPIYLCELLMMCHAGPDDAAANILDAKASPAAISKGDTVQLLADINVTKAQLGLILACVQSFMVRPAFTEDG
ncbi:ctnB, partial [Symbiodinium pilosum]